MAEKYFLFVFFFFFCSWSQGELTTVGGKRPSDFDNSNHLVLGLLEMVGILNRKTNVQQH